MAIEKKKIIEKVKSQPLSEKLLAIVSGVEKYVDGEIIRVKEKQGSGCDVRIFLGVATFVYDPYTKGSYRENFSTDEKLKMRNELEDRFKRAGWKIRVDMCDMGEGNMSGEDYWVLS